MRGDAKTPAEVVCLVGATGTGKSAAALALGRRFKGEIINFDSRQVYSDVPIVTAQPSVDEQRELPHRLYGILSCDEIISAGRFRDLAGRAIEKCSIRGNLPILVGGTGLYLRALIQGLAPIPDIPDEVRSRWQKTAVEQGPEYLHELLQVIDREAADRIAPRDLQRVTRALEIHDHTGKNVSWWLQQTPAVPAYRACKLGLRLDLETLAPRLERRIEAMLSMGALEEVQRAWARCPDRTAPMWSGIGCSELLQVVLGEIGIERAKALWLKNTRAYAKRQMTWFKKDSSIRWFDPEDTRAMIDEVVSWLDG